MNWLKKLIPGKKAPSDGPPPSAAEEIIVNGYCTRGDVPAPTFPHKLMGCRDLSDPELKPHLNGFQGYVMSRGKGQMTHTLYHTLRHIERVRQQWSFITKEENLDAVSAWATRANALIFLPDGNVRDNCGRTLVSARDGSSESNAAAPYPDEAWQRKARTDALLKERGVAVMASLPPVISEPEVRLREASEVVRRSLGALVAAVRAEGMNTGQPMNQSELRERIPLGFAALTPEESAFVANDAPPPEDLPKFGWRYECLFLFAWVLGLVEQLPPPSGICDAGATVRIFLQGNQNQMLETARLRPAAEILDALDLHFRLNWALTEARQGRGAAPANVDGGVVQERHRALNWLVRFEDADWDNVDMPT